jgi:hypothetical protein
MKKENSQNLLHAVIEKGYIAKVTFDALATNFSRITMNISKNGIYINETDKETASLSYIMWSITWNRKNFMTPYVSTKKMRISLNVKNLHKMLKSVKKKDSLTFIITKEKPEELQVLIKPSTQPADSSAKTETIRLPIQQLDVSDASETPDLDVLVDNSGNSVSTYRSPMIIPATDFQKIKKMINVCKTNILVTIQKNEYISFEAGSENVTGNKLEFGQLTYYPENSEEDGEEEEEIQNHDDDDEDQEEEDDEENGEEVEEETENCDDEEYYEDEGDEDYPDVYCKFFTIPPFASLAKLPGLCTQIEFYAPRFEGYPLKIGATALSGLGDIKVYVKDKEIIESLEKGK